MTKQQQICIHIADPRAVRQKLTQRCKATIYSVDLKRVTTYKLTVVFYSLGIFRAPSPGDRISSNSERAAPRRGGEEPNHIEVCNKRLVV